MFQTKAAEKNKILFPRKSFRSRNNVEKYCNGEQAIDNNKIRPMRFACLITEATNTHSEYVICLAFPQQQWLHDRASFLHFTFIASLNFRFSPCVVTVSHFYYPTNALNYIKLRD